MSVRGRTEAVLALGLAHGKSPCFLRCSFLGFVGVGGLGCILYGVVIGEIHVCACCYD